MSARTDIREMSHDQLIAELVADYTQSELKKGIAEQLSGNPRLALLLLHDNALRCMLENLREDHKRQVASWS